MTIKDQVHEFLELEKNENKIDEAGLDRIVLDAIYHGNLPPHHKTFERLWQNMASLFGAGLEITANALIKITCQILNNSEQLAKLRAELEESFPNVDEPLSARANQILKHGS